MLRQKELIARYGNPLASADERGKFEKAFMLIWNYPPMIREAIPSLGKSIYINREFQPTYEKFLNELIRKGLHKEINSNDECFMPRLIRGSKTDISMHTWGIAVDLNPTHNPLGVTRSQAIHRGLRPFSEHFQQTARNCGLVAGYDFGRCDGMHFEMSQFTI
jgi:hypothetical protein